MPKSRSQSTQSIARAAQLIRAISAHNREGVRLVDLARGLDIERPTIYRLVQSLVAEQLIAQDASTRRYYLGKALFELGLTAAGRFNPRELCQPILERLASVTEDTVYLNMRSGLQAVCIDRKIGPFPIKVLTLDVGDRRPLGAGAGGLSILAALPDVEMRAIVKEIESQALPGHRNLNSEKLFSAVGRTREAGYAVHDGDLADVRAVGVAIRRKSGNPFAAISVTAISSRMGQRRIAELVRQLKEAASELEVVLNDRDLAIWNV